MTTSAFDPEVEDIVDEVRSQGDAFELRRYLTEIALRKIEGLRLYRPLAVQKAFHESMAMERIIRGGNRSGKTSAMAVEVARACTGQDPLGRYPQNDGICYLVGKDGREVSQVIYKKLFKPGAFRMIRDKRTGRWRAYDPTFPDDVDRRRESRPALPLIPKRMIVDEAWESKKEQLPKMVRLSNGWELHFFSSNGLPPHGTDIDLCLAGWSKVYDPVAGECRRIDKITGPWHVRSFNERTGHTETRVASRPYIKGYGKIYRVTLSSGREIFTTMKHRVLAADGRWVSVGEVWSRGIPLASCGVQSEGEYLAGSVPVARMPEMFQTPPQSAPSSFADTGSESLHPRDSLAASRSNLQGCDGGYDPRVTGRLQGFLGRCSAYSRPCGERLLSREEGALAFAPSQGDAPERNPWGSLAGDLVLAPSNSRTYQWFVRQASCCVPVAGLFAWALFRLREVLARWFSLLLGSICTTPSLSCFGQCTGHEEGHGQSCGGQSSVSPGEGSVIIISIEEIGEFPIWDITVPETHNYVNGGVINHNCVFDEEILNENWYSEVSARLIDRNGRFIWSATPQAGTMQLYQLHERAEKLKELGARNPPLEEFIIPQSDNVHVQGEALELFKDKLDEEETQVRVHGEFAFLAWKVYPQYRPSVHEYALQEIPSHWTRYVAFDPGHRIGAALFCAVPPPSEGDEAWIYDELYIRECSAAKMAEAMSKKQVGQRFHSFLIDWQAARQHEMASGKTIHEQYSAEFAKHRVTCDLTGNAFSIGDANRKAGIEACRAWLASIDGKRPKLRVLRDSCPNFVTEVKKYRYKRVQGVITDEPEDVKGNTHLMAAWRYIVQANPQWHEPPKVEARGSAAYQAFLKEKKRKEAAAGGTMILGPGTTWRD